jgi:rubrerythrin
MNYIIRLALDQARARAKPPRLQAVYRCLECGHAFRTEKAALRAFEHGCPSCGGVDIDVAVDPSPATPRPA